MGKYHKLLQKLLSGRSDKSIRFIELCNLLVKFGFEERIKGSHHIFYKENVEEIINIQENEGLSKAYQIRQVREIILKFGLEIQEKDEV